VIRRLYIREPEIDKERIDCGDGVDIAVADALQLSVRRVRV
jgi:hypothetical protein